MTSVVEICNLALSDIRAGSINSLTEGTLAAQQCSLKYVILRDRALTEIPWVFNHKIRPLSLVTTDVYNWGYAYQYPTDCLKIHRLVGPQEQISNPGAGVVSRMLDSQLLPISSLRNKIPHEIFNFDDNKVIATNNPDLYIDYASRIENPDLFSADFILALSHLIAAEVSVPVVGGELGRSLRKDSLQLYESYMNAALVNDLNSGHIDQALSEFETIRR